MIKVAYFPRRGWVYQIPRFVETEYTSLTGRPITSIREVPNTDFVGYFGSREEAIEKATIALTQEEQERQARQEVADFKRTAEWEIIK